jgi:hypothetical protein
MPGLRAVARLVSLPPDPANRTFRSSLGRAWENCAARGAISSSADKSVSPDLRAFSVIGDTDYLPPIPPVRPK